MDVPNVARQLSNAFGSANLRWRELEVFREQAKFRSATLSKLALGVGDESIEHVDLHLLDGTDGEQGNQRYLQGDVVLTVFTPTLVVQAKSDSDNLASEVTIFSRAALQQITIFDAPVVFNDLYGLEGEYIVDLRYPRENRVVHLGGPLSTETNQQSLEALLSSLHDDLVRGTPHAK